MANFCCSIETEPRTLKQGQINYAREIAVDIVQNKEPDEASSIFSEGLKPVVGIKEKTVVEVSNTNQPLNSKVEEESMMKIDDVINVESCFQCSCTAAVLDSPSDELRIKEPASAPF